MTPSLDSPSAATSPAATTPSNVRRRLSQSRSYSPTELTTAMRSPKDDHDIPSTSTTTTTTTNRKKLSRSKSSDYSSPGSSTTPRRTTRTKPAAGGPSKLKSLLHDYSTGHADVSSSHAPPRSPVRKTHTQHHHQQEEVVARKFPKARPTPGMELDMSLLDGSESEHTTLDNSGQSVEELIRFRVRNPNSVQALPPPPPPLKPLKLSESQLMMGPNHKALHAIVETEGALQEEEEEEEKVVVVDISNHSTGSASLAFPPPPGSSHHAHSLLGKSPHHHLDDSATSFAAENQDSSSVNMMDETHPTNNTSGNNNASTSTTTAEGSSSYMASYRLSEISNVSHRFSDLSMEASRSMSLLKRASEVSFISNASTLTEASNAPPNNNSLLPGEAPYKRSSTLSTLPPLEQIPNEDDSEVGGEEDTDGSTSKKARAASEPILSSPPHSPKKDTTASSNNNNNNNTHAHNHRSSSSNNTTPQNSKPTCDHTPTSRLLQAVSKNLEEPPKPRRARRNTSGGDTKKDIERALPGLRRTQTSEHNDPMGGGSGRTRWTRRSRSEEEGVEGGMDHSGNNRRSRGVRRCKSSDGTTTGGLGRMRRAGRRGDVNNNGGDEMAESSRRTPLRTKSSDGSIPHMAASSRGRVMRRPSDSKGGEGNVVKLSSSRSDDAARGKHGFRRSKSSVTSAEAEKYHHSRSLSPGRRSKDSSKEAFGAHHPSMLHHSRIKKFNAEDMDKSSSNFGGDNLSKLMASHSGGLFVSKGFD